MLGRPGASDPWGKFRDDPPERGGPAWHPLAAHCADVACVMEALLAQPTIRRRLARAGGLDDLDEVQQARLCWLAFVHDLGKCCRGFRAKAAEEPRWTCGHIKALWGLFGPEELGERALTTLGADTLAAWCGDSCADLLTAVFSHHGQPLGKGWAEYNPSQDRRLLEAWLPRGGDDPFRHLEALVGAAREAFPLAFASADPLPAAPAFQHLYAGLLMLADWLGSGDTPELFPFAERAGEDRAGFARGRAPAVLRAVGLDPAPLRDRLAPGLPAFADQFGFAPNEVQRQVDLLPPPAPGGVVLLESETGSGKTEAALRWATRLFADGSVDGCFFAVPLRSAAVQLHRRMQRWLDRTFGAGAAEALLAVPGYFLRMGEAEGTKLPDFSVQWTDGAPEERRLARWASEQPKRYAAAAFAVGTIDQALLGVLRVKHAHLRAACLVRHLLVVDEVHASDPYMRWLVERLVGLFRACGGQVLLMSATLGAGLRTLLIDGPRVRIPARDDATRLPYPLISGAPGGPRPVAPEGRAKAVEIALLPLIDEPSAVAARAAEAAGEGARVLVLRNTVAAAIATQEALEALLPAGDPALFRVGETVTMHHGRFAAEDRRLLDKAIEERFGKGSTRRPGVVVATQTVEQSLDVDFDLLVTDLCPIDILLQRIGRLHRHPGPRPTGFEVARCLILGPEGGDLSPYLHATRHGIGLTRKGEARAYPDVRAVEATRQLIGAGARWTIPADNRRLVEEGTHPGALDAIAADFKGAWERHGGAVLGNIISQGSLARDNAIDFRRVFGEVGFGHGVGGALKTRLGLDDLLLPLDRPLVSPFGQTLARMRLPGWMIRKETWEAIGGQDEPTIAVGEDGGLALDGQRFVYDRLGLRPWVGP